MGLEPRGGLSVKKTNWFLAKISEVLKTEEDKCVAFVSLMAHHLNLIHEQYQSLLLCKSHFSVGV